MRAVLLLALLAIATAPAASAAKESPVIVDPYAEVGGDCDTCLEASLLVYQGYPDNCADCPDLTVFVGVEHDGRNVHADAVVCRGGFVTICVVDEHVTV